MRVSSHLKKLESARAKLAKLEGQVAAERASELASLPAEYGFDGMNEFITALRSAGGKRRGRKPGKASKASGGKRRSRARITDEIRASVKKMVEGGKTGAEIAKTLKISLPSVQNIKKAYGLVKKR